jgi:hypothetical protein
MKTQNRKNQPAPKASASNNITGDGNNNVVAAAASGGQPDPLHNMGEIFQAGHRLLGLVSTRPGLTVDHVFKALDMTFPNGVAGFSNAKYIAEYKKSCEYRVKEETFTQWAFHLNAFSVWLGKSFIWATPADFEHYIRSKTIKKNPDGADKVVQSTHDHLIDVFRTYYNWLRGRAYYSPLLDNPVQMKRIGTRRRLPKESAIFSAQEYALLLASLPWWAIPTAVCLFELGVRPGVIKRLSFSDVELDAVVHLTRLINKAGAAYPVLYPGIKAKLMPWSHCSGPVMVYAGILELIRDTIREVLGREDYNDDARKTAISMRAAILIHEDAANAEARLDEEFGNSSDVREIYYRVRRLPKGQAAVDAAKAYFAVSWEPTPVSLPAAKAREMREAQIRSAGRVAMAISEAKQEITHDASKKKRAMMRAKAEQNARATLPKEGLMPVFVKVQGDWDLSPEQRKAIEQKALSAEKASSLLALAEQFAHDEHQMSLFHGRPDLVEGPAISQECPTTNPPTETGSSSISAPSPIVTP